jgi:hypothetical protein
MIKKLLVVSLAALGIGLTGCLTDPTEVTTPTITLGKIDTLTAGSGASRTVTGKIEGSDVITKVTYQVTNSAGTSVSTITVSGPDGNSKKSLDLSVVVLALTGTPAGTYTLKISATAGATGDGSFTFSVKGPAVVVSDITVNSVTLGAHDNTLGSSVNLDNGSVLPSAQAVLANSGVDILYTYSQKVTSPILFNPAYAKDSSGITAFAAWVTPNATKFHKVTGNFDAITTAAQIEALYDANSSFSGRLTVAVGDLIIVKTDLGKYVLIKMMTVSANATGTAEIKYAK